MYFFHLNLLYYGFGFRVLDPWHDRCDWGTYAWVTVVCLVLSGVASYATYAGLGRLMKRLSKTKSEAAGAKALT
jgi:hypothetical protein